MRPAGQLDSSVEHGVGVIATRGVAAQATQPLAAAQLSQEQQAVASHMCALGLMKPEVLAGEMLFCPTFLAGLLCGAAVHMPGAAPSIGGFIVVETSFRVYAYTSSPVQVRVAN
jgi:Transcription factor Tfb2